ncbi:MAG: HAD family hydrolase [Rhizobiaceae bacterium]
MMKAIIFGSIGTIVETSELQRRAFNRAFEANGLDWFWTQATYRELLASNGGLDRIAEYAVAKRQSVDAEALHERKGLEFHRLMGTEPLYLRPGVANVVTAARRLGIKLGLATATSIQNVDTLMRETPGIEAHYFDFVGHAGLVQRGKPHPDIYHLALSELGIASSDAIAVEDSETSMQAALDAGLSCLAFPGEMHAHNAFRGATSRLSKLSFQQVVGTPELVSS